MSHTWFPPQNHAPYHSAFSSTSRKTSPVNINQCQVELSWEAFRTNAPFRIGNEQFKFYLFDQPFEVVLSGFALKNDIKRKLVNVYWMPFIRTAHDWLNAIGFFPYYFKKVKIFEPPPRIESSLCTIAPSPPFATRTGKKTKDDDKTTTLESSQISRGISIQPQVGGNISLNSDDSVPGLSTFSQMPHKSGKKKKQRRDLNHNKFDSIIGRDDKEEEEEIPKKSTPPMPSYVIHLVPVIPPTNSGQIQTYLDKKEQKLLWIWNENIASQKKVRKEDKQMNWYVENWPSLQGDLTSAISSIIPDWLHVRRLESISVNVAESLSNPLHIIEFQPPAGSGSTETEARSSGNLPGVSVRRPLTDLEQVAQWRQKQINMGFKDADVAVGLNPQNTHLLAQIPTHQLNDARRQAYLLNHPPHSCSSIHEKDCGSTCTKSKRLSMKDRYPNNTLTLDTYERYVHAAVPQNTDQNLTQHKNRLDKLMAAIVGFPIESIMNQTGTSTGARSDSLNEFITSKIKTRGKIYSEMLKRIWKEAYSLALEEGRRATKKMAQVLRQKRLTAPELRYLDEQFEVTIRFSQAPAFTLTEISEYYKHGVFDETDFYTYAMATKGLNATGKPLPKELARKLKMLYDPEYQHKIQMKWVREEQAQSSHTSDSSTSPEELINPSSTQPLSNKIDPPLKSRLKKSGGGSKSTSLSDSIGQKDIDRDGKKSTKSGEDKNNSISKKKEFAKLSGSQSSSPLKKRKVSSISEKTQNEIPKKRLKSTKS